MFYYLKDTVEGGFLAMSTKRPINTEGLIELTEEEYLAKLAELNPPEEPQATTEDYVEALALLGVTE